mgnify:CR=1 FL=1|tara:strand:+ start:115 stop:966 length:852 start_codon:yes stop_codon:yes gene_type:complete
MSIYFSTGGYKNQISRDVVKTLIDVGIKDIELSGTCYSKDNIKDLKQLLKFSNLQIHNYFPPPKKPFVLNLASMDEAIAQKTIDHIMYAIDVCKELNCKYYSFHAGFLCDIKVSELGKKVDKKILQNREESLDLFINRILKISERAKQKNINIMIENNVLSKNNQISFEGNPFLMCDADECEKVINSCPENVKLLIDVAHLKVSSNSLNFDKIKFLDKCNHLAGGYHLSDNDGLSDSNDKFDNKSWFWDHIDRKKDYYSIEVYNLRNNEIKELINIVKNKLAK